MQYRDSSTALDTPKKILKVNHAGEFGAINIYRAQQAVCRWFNPKLLPMLAEFERDETKHLNLFWDEIQRRDGVKCKSYGLCGLGGYAIGFISALLGAKGIMACTWAVESVVVAHLNHQLEYLAHKNDAAASQAIQAILDDEVNHRDVGLQQGGANIFYTPLRFLISTFTEGVIRFGLR